METKTSTAKFQALRTAIRKYYMDKATEVEYIERYDREVSGYRGGWTIRTSSGEMTRAEAVAAIEEIQDAIDLVENIEDWGLVTVEEGTPEEYQTTRDEISEIMQDGDWAAIWGLMKL